MRGACDEYDLSYDLPYDVPCDVPLRQSPPASTSGPLVPSTQVPPPLPPQAASGASGTSPSSQTTSSNKSKRRRKKKQRVIDETRAIEYTDDDVLFGRGGLVNKHPGNIKFRQRALELRPWYESVSKEE